jgi:exonuclease SbcC
LLKTVPCHGIDKYAACQFLTNASAAAATIATLEQQLAGLTDAVRARDALVEANLEAANAIAGAHRVIAALEQDKATHQALAKYAEPLAAASGTPRSRRWPRVASGRAELDLVAVSNRRRTALTEKRTTLAEYTRRRAAIDRELVEWRDLAKALGKGGLPDLEIDAAGPSISALCNTILLDCFGPRFSLELVTQIAKADGSGMKDEFTVRVTDNAAGGAGATSASSRAARRSSSRRR